MARQTVALDDWEYEVRHMLISAGLLGIKQSVFSQRLKGHAVAEDVLVYLEMLRKEGKVDKYVNRKGKRGGAPTYWRATRKILE